MEWLVSKNLVPYEQAIEVMEQRVAAIYKGSAQECVWLLEHPPLYTAGTSAQSQDLLNPQFPVYKTGRGGQYTYHGPGQRVCYVMLNLASGEAGRHKDIRRYISQLEEWVQQSLAHFSITALPHPHRVGLWVNTPQGEEKIAAIGVRVRRWVTFHGVAINVNPDLSHFQGIVPCGLSEFGVTSLKKLGIATTQSALNSVLKKQFFEVFSS